MLSTTLSLANLRSQTFPLCSNGASNKGKRSANKTERRKQNQEARLQEIREIIALRRRIETEAPPAGSNPLAFESKRGGSGDVDADEPERVIVDPKDPNYAKQQRKLEAARKADKQKQQPQHRNGGAAGPGPAAAAGAGGKTYALMASLNKFADLPISSRTKRALEEAGFTHLTKIQRGAIPHALAGRDVLGAARTGSGKTLAFLIPAIEKLYMGEWDPRTSGLGAVIISPTRELAVQIFDVLRVVGKHHEYSAGLVIGGKDFKEEQKLIGAMNILVGTPGRLLQHSEQTYTLDLSRVGLLVLDEADRILDMGFRDALDALIQAMPAAPERQTLLFSATQTKEVRALARLSLSEPEYVAVHEGDANATPLSLSQHFMSIPAGLKIDVLYSFIRTHVKHKTIVFASSCKEVRFLYEMLRRLRPGVPVMHIHGKMKQPKRLSIYYDFCNKKEACMLATDIAARGLDFPDVDWVVQLDCPDSVDTYIHRVGRTARYRASGNSLLMLLPSEVAMLDNLKKVGLRCPSILPFAMVLRAPICRA